jgi:RNA polymerase sigma factor (sigma-70 family)
MTMGELFACEESPLLRFAWGITGRRALAEEAVQEAFLRLHTHWNDVQNPKAWLYRCVRNLSLNELRDRSKETSTAEPPEEGDGSLLPNEQMARFEASGILRLLVAELPPLDKTLIDLKYHEHLGYAEISRRTGLGVGNVGYRLHHILKTLAEALRRSGVESSIG